MRFRFGGWRCSGSGCGAAMPGGGVGVLPGEARAAGREGCREAGGAAPPARRSLTWSVSSGRGLPDPTAGAAEAGSLG